MEKQSRLCDYGWSSHIHSNCTNKATGTCFACSSVYCNEHLINHDICEQKNYRLQELKMNQKERTVRAIELIAKNLVMIERHLHDFTEMCSTHLEVIEEIVASNNSH